MISHCERRLFDVYLQVLEPRLGLEYIVRKRGYPQTSRLPALTLSGCKMQPFRQQLWHHTHERWTPILLLGFSSVSPHGIGAMWCFDHMPKSIAVAV